MSEPDELYTLRALYWLGHYNLCLEEAKSVSRRPMAAHLKVEREQFVLRALLALKQYDKVLHDSTGEDKDAGIQALALQAQFENPQSSPQDKASAVAMLQHFLMDDSLSNNSSSSLVQLVAAQVFLSTGEMTREALQCVYLGTTMEHLALVIQIYLKMDRVDLAMDTLELMRQADEEAILTHLSSCRCKMTLGRSKIQEVIHSLSTLMEQYGPSPLLLNMIGSAYLIAGSYDQAEKILEEAAKVEEESVGIPSVDTLINTICCMQHLGKIGNRHGVVEKLKSWYAEHSFVQGLIRMETAFEREAIKYKVSA